MSLSGDTSDDMRRPRQAADLDDVVVEALIAGRYVASHAELASIVAELQSLAHEPPRPSPELSVLLAQGIATPLVATPPRPSFRVGVTLGAVILTVSGGTIGAASANVLPPRAQRAVADAVQAVTPLHLPRPTRPASLPTPAPSPTPSPRHATLSTPQELGHPDPASPNARGGQPGDAEYRQKQVMDGTRSSSQQANDNGEDDNQSKPPTGSQTSGEHEDEQFEPSQKQDDSGQNGSTAAPSDQTGDVTGG
jgi:hypothetical protein